ncbi:nucleosome assembly protein 1-like 1 [Schistocerca nitens]|uniref:nucleosome assembly protein 1-like 1 n=1 Tax=Schistocerca nitens TaxID=7011 RepID=UPI00211945CC|nr:nucleosome assembly protein 1-like 1 [Schistocerca nitens]XP_049790913.1 nucleosome assembly protein 1-like 1 [Schistocerca nitens]
MADPERIGDAAEDLEEMEEEEEPTKVAITEEMLQRPEVLAALQGTLHREMMEALPASVKRRIKALKKLQLESTHIEAKFYEEVHLLECKYHKLYSPLYEKRGEVISGLYEPTEAECEWESDDEKIDEVSDALKKKVKIDGGDSEGDKNDVNKNEDVKGIPDFWLTIFKNVQLLSEMVQEHDEPILKHLIDIKVIFLESSPMGFVLEFHFSQNEYFSNSVLTKEYEMKCKPDESDPFSFEGPEIFKCKGCVIDWKKGKNVTVKTIKKKQKHKSRGAVRTVTKTIQNDSFFNFFSPPAVPDDQDAEIDEETRALLTTDFEIGHYIRERIVPRAVLYYTGEALEDEDFEEEEEGEEGEEEEDDDDDPTYKPGNRISVRSGNNPTPGDCKQQ